jgi:hypothetical protein
MRGYFDEWAAQGKFPPYTTHDKQIDGIDRVFCNARRPDFFWDFGTWVLIVENDEDQHRDEDISCHHARNDDIINSFGAVPIFMIRYNSDAFKVGGVAQTIANYEKMDILLDLMTRKLKDPPIRHQLEICYMFLVLAVDADADADDGVVIIIIFRLVCDDR